MKVEVVGNGCDHDESLDEARAAACPDGCCDGGGRDDDRHAADAGGAGQVPAGTTVTGIASE